MRRKRLSLRQPFASVYDRPRGLSSFQLDRLVEVWSFLQLVCLGELEIEIDSPPGTPALYEVRLPSGERVRLVIGRPAPGDPDDDCDLFVQDCIWTEQTN